MAAGARAFRRDTSIFSSKPVNPGFSGLSELGEFKPATGDVAEPTASTGVSLRNRGAHSLNNRSFRTFTFGSGLSGPSNGRGLLGNHEPGAAISDGVANGTVDSQGNPSSVPTFGADSRVAADAGELGLAFACVVGAWHGALNGAKIPGPAPVKAAGALAGALIGCPRAMTAKQITDTMIEANAEKPEKKEEEDKKAKEKKEEDKKAKEKKEEDKKAKAKEEETDKKSKTTPKPGDDNANRPRNVSFEEMTALFKSGSGSLTNPGNEDDSLSSVSDVGMIDPFSRIEARRRTLIRPTNEGSFRGGHALPAGDASDSLIQPPDPDENNPTPVSSSEEN